mgnify:CR=1 FL=1
MMAWWSDTFLLFSTRPNCGERSRPAAKGSRGHRPDTMLFRRGLHIVGKVLAVSSRISQQLLFIKLLGIVKGLLGGKSKQAVGLPLQRRKVVDAGRLLCLFLPLYCYTNGLRSCTGRLDGVSVGSTGNAVAGRLHAARRDMDNVIFLFLEIADLGLPVNQHF